MSVPPGWEPLLVDPASDERLGLAVKTSFLLGAFVPREPKGSDFHSGRYVLILDDVRYGPLPVRAIDFTSV